MASDNQPYGIGSDVWPGLAKLMEEMGELQEVLGKVMACTTLNGVPEYWDGTNLRPRLIEEMGDVMASILFFSEANGFRDIDVQDRAAEKLSKFRFWHGEHSKPNPPAEHCRTCGLEIRPGDVARAEAQGSWAHVNPRAYDHWVDTMPGNKGHRAWPETKMHRPRVQP